MAPVTEEQVKQVDACISELCDAGNIEAYPTEAFVSIARRLVESAFEPRRSPVQPQR